MSTKANFFKIGLFVIGANVILLAGIFILSARALVTDTILVETYVDESVQGLSVGSPVRLRGVEIGRVERISFVPKEYDMRYGSTGFWDYGKYVVVVMSVDRSIYPDMTREKMQQVAEEWVTLGMRMKLSSQGLTGLMYMEAEYLPESEKNNPRYAPMKLGWKPRNLYIPSIPSTKTSLTRAADNVMELLDELDFVGIANALDTALTSLDATLKTADTTLAELHRTVQETRPAQIREEVVGLIADLRETNRYVQKLLAQRPGPDALGSIPAMVAQLNRTLKRMNRFVSGQQSQVDDIMNDIRKASANLRVLTEFAKRHPARLLFGDPPPPSEVEE